MTLFGDVIVEKLAGDADHVLSGRYRARRLCRANEPLAAIVQVMRPCACVWSG